MAKRKYTNNDYILIGLGALITLPLQIVAYPLWFLGKKLVDWKYAKIERVEKERE